MASTLRKRTLQSHSNPVFANSQRFLRSGLIECDQHGREKGGVAA